MWYYIFLATIDIGLFLADKWKELTFTAVATGVGVIFGKRIGSRIVFNQFIKRLGLEKKSELEQQVAWLIELERSRGNQWSANISKPYRLNIHRLLLKRSIWSRMARSIARFTKPHTRWRKRNMRAYLKKLGSRKFQALLVSLIVNIGSAVLFMTGTVDMDSIINEWMPIINMTIGTISTWVYLWVEGGIDKATIQKEIVVIEKEANSIDNLDIPIEPSL